MNQKKGGIYIHLPFCRSKCLYCDFYTGGLRIADWKIYTDCLLNELDRRKEEMNFEVASIYLGGGTPSLMPSEEMGRLIETISKNIDISELKEFTIEVNPEDVDKAKVEFWKNIGINRISLGIQSLDNEELKLIGRNHDAATSKKALEILKEKFDNISVDVIFGLPEQTISSYHTTLETLTGYEPQHVSAYSLMLEEGTALTHLHDKGKFELPDEEEWIEMFELTSEYLAAKGYNRYEVSNYAKPGYESFHNKGYWEGRPYIGLGAGAHSYDGENKRKWNLNDIKGYIKSSEEVSRYELLSEDELKEEMIMMRLRMSIGLDLYEFEKKFGVSSKINLLQNADIFIKNSELKEENNFLSLTGKGFLLYNQIVSSLIM